MRIETIFPDTYNLFPRLMHEMFLDRAAQFQDRLGWAVKVTDTGEERDQYDHMQPIYLVARSDAGRHLGSMRFLPMSGPTMLLDHFSELVPPSFLIRKNEFECTRFCIAPDLDRETAKMMVSLLLLEGCRLALRLGCPSTLGIFHPAMLRVYKKAGWSPAVLGIKEFGGDTIVLGRWEVGEACRLKLRQKVASFDVDKAAAISP